MSWAKGHERCQSCGTTERKHKARGLCASCYDATAEKRHKSHVTRRTGSRLPIPITKEDLEHKYQSGLSLNDIARQFNCTRQNIHKLMRNYRIVRRTMSEARNLALDQGKVSYSSEIYSPGTTISHEKRHVNESFFTTWTPAMAWVLGVIYTDGCLHASPRAEGQSKSDEFGKLRHRELVKLADCGDATAQFYLAAMYGHGIQALKWYTLAAEGGDEGAAVARDELSKKMSPVQVAEARRQAEKWVPQDKQAMVAHWRLSIGQKEPELLEKVRALMDSNAMIRFSKKRGVAGALHTLVINNATVCADLRQLGVTPRKSLTITFPLLPSHLVRHFIRGCWDGDGSVYWTGTPPRPGASFLSGSKDFIEQLVRHLVTLGLPDRTIHIRNPTKSSAHRSYSFRFSERNCALLYHVLYDNVDERMYLRRKRDTFKTIADNYECQVSPAQHKVPIRRRVTSLSDQIARADLRLRSESTYRIINQLRTQQIKAANAAIKKRLGRKTGTFSIV